MPNDMRTVTLGVLLRAGFGKSFDFQGTSHELQSSSSMTNRDALQSILENAILLFALGPRILSRIKFPPTLAHIGRAVVAYKDYLEKELAAEKQRISHGLPTQGPLMASLIRASSSKDGLNDNEIFGNMFVFQFAGHDTTAYTLSYTFMQLIGTPGVQEWMAEELDYYIKDVHCEDWSYEKLFPCLKRVLAVQVNQNTHLDGC
jgi:cytochrome P450